jgi:hypothetical protein
MGHRKKKKKKLKTYFRIACIFRPYKDLKELDKTCKMKSMVFRITLLKEKGKYNLG